MSFLENVIKTKPNIRPSDKDVKPDLSETKVTDIELEKESDDALIDLYLETENKLAKLEELIESQLKNLSLRINKSTDPDTFLAVEKLFPSKVSTDDAGSSYVIVNNEDIKAAESILNTAGLPFDIKDTFDKIDGDIVTLPFKPAFSCRELGKRTHKDLGTDLQTVNQLMSQMKVFGKFTIVKMSFIALLSFILRLIVSFMKRLAVWPIKPIINFITNKLDKTATNLEKKLSFPTSKFGKVNIPKEWWSEKIVIGLVGVLPTIKYEWYQDPSGTVFPRRKRISFDASKYYMELAPGEETKENPRGTGRVVLHLEEDLGGFLADVELDDFSPYDPNECVLAAQKVLTSLSNHLILKDEELKGANVNAYLLQGSTTSLRSAFDISKYAVLAASDLVGYDKGKQLFDTITLANKRKKLAETVENLQDYFRKKAGDDSHPETTWSKNKNKTLFKKIAAAWCYDLSGLIDKFQDVLLQWYNDPLVLCCVIKGLTEKEIKSPGFLKSLKALLRFLINLNNATVQNLHNDFLDLAKTIYTAIIGTIFTIIEALFQLVLNTARYQVEKALTKEESLKCLPLFEINMTLFAGINMLEDDMTSWLYEYANKLNKLLDKSKKNVVAVETKTKLVQLYNLLDSIDSAINLGVLCTTKYSTFNVQNYGNGHVPSLDIPDEIGYTDTINQQIEINDDLKNLGYSLENDIISDSTTGLASKTVLGPTPAELASFYKDILNYTHDQIVEAMAPITQAQEGGLSTNSACLGHLSNAEAEKFINTVTSWGLISNESEEN